MLQVAVYVCDPWVLLFLLCCFCFLCLTGKNEKRILLHGDVLTLHPSLPHPGSHRMTLVLSSLFP